MKIRPVILCGGAGTRLWSKSKNNHEAKQFIDFGGWNLFGKTLQRINNPLFDSPIISTNLNMDEKTLINEIKNNSKTNKFLKDKNISRIIHIKNKLINLIIK